MAISLAEFGRRSERLLSASESFGESLPGDEADLDQAADELLSAAKPSGSVTLNLEDRGVDPPTPVSVTDDLAAILLELQSGNLLVAAGLERREIEHTLQESPLDLARAELSTAREEITAPPPPLRLAEKLGVASETVDSAKQQFRNYSEQLLGEIVDKVLDTISSAIKGLKKLGIDQITNAVGELGKSISGVADVGRLIRRGVESIKRAIDALINLIGSEAIEKVKEGVAELWEKLGGGGKAIIEPLLGVEKVKKSITALLESTALSTSRVDVATNSLGPLSAGFVRETKILSYLISGIALAAGLLTFLHAVAPWVPLALAIAYVTAIAAVLAVGGDYTGGRRLLGRIEGVEQIAEHLRVP